jgi:FAD-linked oxidoreductase
MNQRENWSGYIQWQPKEVLYPRSKEDIIQIIQSVIEKKQKVRAVGSGHSCTKLCVTDDILVSLDNYQGIVHIDRANKLVTVKAGTKLNLLNTLLDAENLALENLGDIDVQSAAGAICTATHGTGVAFGNISSQVQKIEFINGRAEIITCSENDNSELFRAAQVSLGVLGIITEITFRCVDSYVLRLNVEKKNLFEVLDNLDSYNGNCRNFEFYFFPNTDSVMTKELRLSDAPPQQKKFKDYIQEDILENYAFKVACDVAHYLPSTTKRISEFSANTISSFHKTRKSFEVLSSSRLVRFNEMEYNVPAECYGDVKKELVRWIDKNNTEVMFPLENRFVKEDNILLSPSYQRKSAYIAAHVYKKADFTRYFKGLEDIFKSYDGRPHWGKMHTLQSKDLEKLYPEFAKFNTQRKLHDPDEVFLTPYLKELLQ